MVDPADPADPADAVSFCPSCGRRVEGWKTGFRASVGGAGAEPVVRGLDEPTRALAPSRGLLRDAVAAHVAEVRDTEVVPVVSESGGSRPVRRRSGLGGLLLLLGGAITVAIVPMVVIAHFKQKAIVVGPAVETSVVAPVIDVPEPVAQPKVVEPPKPEPAKPVEPAKPEPARPAAIVVAPVLTKPPASKPPASKQAKPVVVGGQTHLVAVAPKPGPSSKGGLPHKASGKTDSRANDVSAQPSGTGGPPLAQRSGPPALVAGPGDDEHAPQTPEERHIEDATRADADNVRFVVQAHLPQVQACYGRAFKDSAPPGGRIDIGFVVGSNGRASHLRTESNATQSKALAGCLQQRIAEWQFPRPSTGEFELIYPFVFSPGG
ncbi:MAG: AgmX/PglI C-terminal domain-containing protein [Polyangia bacterium]